MTTKTSRVYLAASAALLLLAAGCGSSGGGGGTPPAFTQADLTGEWDFLQFSTNSSPGWLVTHARLDAAGQVEVLSQRDDAGDTTLPPSGFDLKATVDGTGTVRLGGADGSAVFHGSLVAGKTLVFGTDQSGTPAPQRRTLHVWRKRVPGVTYSAADVASFPFVIHGIDSGGGYGWFWGLGSTDADGVVTLSELHDSDGAASAPGPVATLAIDADGVVVNVAGALRGVMAPDKKAIFFVDLSGDVPPSPGFRVVLRTGQAFTPAELAGDRRFHSLVSGADTASSSWTHGTTHVDASGLSTFTSYLNSAGSTALPPARQLVHSASGVVTVAADATFHGQLAWDGSYMVRTSGAPAAPQLALSAR